MSTPIPQWCPYCRAATQEVHPEATRYTCGSQVSSTDGIGMTIQRDLCRIRELLQLRDRVKRLEEAGDALIDAIESVQCWNETHVGDCIEQLQSAKGQP